MNNYTYNSAMYSAILSSLNEEGKDLLWPFEQIVAIFIEQDTSHHYTVKELRDKVKEKTDIAIPEIPMRKIIKRLVAANKLIQRKQNSATYCPVGREVSSTVVLSESSMSAEYKKLISTFHRFIITHPSRAFMQITLEEAEAWFCTFLEQQACEITLSHIPDKLDAPEAYLTAKFIEECFFSSKSEKELILKVATGYMISKSIFLPDEDAQIGKESLSNLSIVLDTPILFNALGINPIDSKSVYCDLLGTIKSQGASLVTFTHIINEMEFLLESAMHWASRTDYDPLRASITQEYYFDSDRTKDDIQFDLLMLRSNIKKLGIEIIEDYYDPSQNNFYEDQKKIMQFIIGEYRCKSKDDTDAGIQNDARSINSIYIHRKGARTINFTEAKWLLLTSNHALISAALKYDQTISSRKSISTCITDSFLGTMLWLSSPRKIAAFANSKLALRLYSALEPSYKLLDKYIAAVNRLETAGEITPEQAVLLRLNGYAKDQMMDVTLGDDDAVTDDTPGQVLKSIEDRTRKEEEVKRIQLDEEYRTRMSAIEVAHAKEIDKKDLEIKTIKEKSESDKKQRIKDERENKIQDKVKSRIKLIYFIFFAILPITLIGVVYVLWKCSILDLIWCCVAAVFPILSVAINLYFKKFAPQSIVEEIKTYLYKKYEKSFEIH